MRFELVRVPSESQSNMTSSASAYQVSASETSTFQRLVEREADVLGRRVALDEQRVFRNGPDRASPPCEPVCSLKLRPDPALPESAKDPVRRSRRLPMARIFVSSRAAASRSDSRRRWEHAGATSARLTNSTNQFAPHARNPGMPGSVATTSGTTHRDVVPLVRRRTR
jgi:hypothetical protein